jgi:prepilin-type N-terminal cleavage/methylation domain-containing protein
MNIKKGVTLIELVVGIAIIGIIGAPLLGLFTSSIQNNSMARSKTSIAAVAQAFMDYYKKNGVSIINNSDTSYESYCFIYSNGDDISETLPKINLSEDVSIDNTFSSLKCKFVADNSFDYIIKTTFIKKDTNLIEIQVTVWDTMYQDKNRFTLISLRSL